MEDIAEVNDLACSSIESGDYHVALDVLNRCLACVKQLKNCRVPTTVTGANNTNSDKSKSSSSIVVVGEKENNENISTVLREAKQKLLLSSKSNTVTTTTAMLKRKSSAAAAAANATTSTVTARGMILRPRKRRRNEQEQQQQGVECPLLMVPDVAPTTVSASRDYNNNDHQQQCIDVVNVADEGYFVYRKPLRLTESQLIRIAECREFRRRRNSNSNSKSNSIGSQCQQRQCQLEREIELAVSSNLIFNIALSHHLIAVTSTENENKENDKNNENTTDVLRREQRLKGALRLYELGFRVHAKRTASAAATSPIPMTATAPPSSSSSSSNDTTNTVAVDNNNNNNNDNNNTLLPLEDQDDELRSATRYALALINNCAHIHEALGRNDRANVFRNRLLSFLLMMVDGGESMNEIVSDDAALDGYLRNVFSRSIFDTKKAPAAAA